MTIVGSNQKDINVGWLVGNFRRSRPDAAATLAAFGLGDQFLEDFLRPFVESPFPYYREPIFNELVERIELVPVERGFVPQYHAGPLEVQVVSERTAFPPGLEVTQGPFRDTEINTMWMKIDATLLIRGPAPEAGQWEVGFVQTVWRLNRRAIWRGDDETISEWRSETPGPTKDGPHGFKGPFYDDGKNYPVVVRLKERSFQEVTIRIKDRPGYSMSPPKYRHLERVLGGESFTTWIVMRRIDGSQTAFFRAWNWRVEYTIEPMELKHSGIMLVSYEENASGKGALFDGPTTKDSIRNEVREETFVNPKKKFTFGFRR